MEMTINEIHGCISDIKRKASGTETNYSFSLTGSEKTFDVIHSSESIVFLNRLLKRNDVYYFTSDMEDCLRLLDGLPADTMLPVVSKDEGYDIHRFEEAGFIYYARYERFGDRVYPYDEQMELMKSNKLDPKYDESYGRYPEIKDIPEIQSILEDTFDPLTDDFFSDDEMAKMIEEKNIVIERTDKRIYCINIFQIHGRKFYGNILWNIGMPYVSYSIEKRTLLEAIKEHGVNYRYLWINTANNAALKRNLTPRSEGIYSFMFRKK